MGLTQEPSWVANRPTSDQYFIGIGFAEKNAGRNFREKAKADALSDLASEISVSVSSKLISIATEYSGYSEDYVRNEIKVSTSKELEGYERVGEYESRGRYWVFYRLPKSYFNKYAEQANNYYGNYLTIEEDDPVLRLELLIPCFVSVFKAVGQDVYYNDGKNNIDLRVEVRSQIRRVLGDIQLETDKNTFDVYYQKGLSTPITVFAQNSKTGNPVQYLPITFTFTRGFGDLSDTNLSTDKNGKVSTTLSLIRDKVERQTIKATVDLVDFKPEPAKDHYIDNILKGIADLKSVEFRLNVNVLKRDIVGVIVVGSGLSKMLLEALTKNFNTQFKKKTDFVIMDYRQAKDIIERENYDPTTCMGAECQVEIGKSLGVDKLIFIDITYLSGSGIIDVSTTMRNIGSLAVQESHTSRLKIKGSIDNFLLTQVPNLVDEFWNYINPAYVNLITNIPDVVVDIIPVEDNNVDIISSAMNVYKERLLPGLYRFEFEKLGYESKSFRLKVEKGETYSRTITLKKKSKAKAFRKSLFVPGSGQKYTADEGYKGRRRAATTFRLSILSGVAATGYAWTLYDNSKKDYDKAKADYLNQTTIEGISSNKKIAIEKNKVMRNNQNLVIAAAALTGLIWFSNALEAAINFPDYGYSFSVNTSITVATNNRLITEPLLTLTYKF